VRLLADLNVAPRTVEFLRSLGHDVGRVAALLPATATDAEIVEAALRKDRTRPGASPVAMRPTALACEWGAEGWGLAALRP
jgi:hypothetical protein